MNDMGTPARPSPPPRQPSHVRLCNRYRHDGSACGNTTVNADGWCREESCPGFKRRNMQLNTRQNRPPFGTPKHIAQTGSLPVGEIDIADLPHVKVTRRATDSYQFHHGGPCDEAEVELRAMLEDFLLESARRTSGRGFLVLANSGYEIVLSPDRSALTAYRTVHRERTWFQFKTGVPSRYALAKQARRRAMLEASGEAPEFGEAIPVAGSPDVAAAAAQIDPATIHIAVTALRYHLEAHPDTTDPVAIGQRMRERLATSLCHPELSITVVRVGELWLTTPDGPAWGLRGDGRSVTRYATSAEPIMNKGLSRDTRGRRPPRGNPISQHDPETVRASIHPQAVFITALTLNMYNDRHRLTHLDDGGLETRIRFDLANDLAIGHIDALDSGSHGIRTETALWLVSDDCRFLIAYKSPHSGS